MLSFALAVARVHGTSSGTALTPLMHVFVGALKHNSCATQHDSGKYQGAHESVCCHSHTQRRTETISEMTGWNPQSMS